MRVVYISATGQLGGAERVLLDLIAWLTRERPQWQPHLLSLEDGPLPEATRALGVPTEVVPLPPELSRLGEAGQSPAALALAVTRLAWPLRASVARLREVLQAIDPDIVHANGLKPNLLAALALPSRARLVWHVHDYLSGRPFSGRALRWLGGRCNLVLAISDDVARDVRAVMPRRPPVRAVLNGVDVDHFISSGPIPDLDARAGLSAPPRDAVRVGLIATFARWKGHDVFLDALARLDSDLPFRAYIIGDALYSTTGSQFSRSELESRAAARGLSDKVGFTGFLADRPATLRALDVIVHASTAPEPFGLVIAEAMAAGRAVITTATGGSAELVSDGDNALVTPAADPTALAAALTRLIADPGLRLRLGAAGRRSAIERFTLARFGAAVEDAYRGLLVEREWSPITRPAT